MGKRLGLIISAARLSFSSSTGFSVPPPLSTRSTRNLRAPHGKMRPNRRRKTCFATRAVRLRRVESDSFRGENARREKRPDEKCARRRSCPTPRGGTARKRTLARRRVCGPGVTSSARGPPRYTRFSSAPRPPCRGVSTRDARVCIVQGVPNGVRSGVWSNRDGDVFLFFFKNPRTAKITVYFTFWFWVNKKKKISTFCKIPKLTILYT